MHIPKQGASVAMTITDHDGNTWSAKEVAGHGHWPEIGNATVKDAGGEVVCHTEKAPQALQAGNKLFVHEMGALLDFDDPAKGHAIQKARQILIGGAALPLDVRPGEIPHLCKPSGHKR